MSNTRVWWDGREVVFVRWTDRSLVFAWCDAGETATQMPRGAVIRLVEKGVLRIEGMMPDWIHQTQRVSAPPHVQSVPVRAPVTTPKSEPSSKFTAIARLIRKLSGGEPKSSPHTVG